MFEKKGFTGALLHVKGIKQGSQGEKKKILRENEENWGGSRNKFLKVQNF